MLTAAVLVVLAALAWPGRGRGPADERELGDDVPGGSLWGLVRRRRRRSVDDGRWVADLGEVVAVGLDAGLDLPSAVVAAARSPSVARQAPWLADRVAEETLAGESASSCLDPPGPCPAAVRHDLGLLAAAWRLAEDAGAPAAVVTAAAADAVRERHVSRGRAEVAVAGPRTSMMLLTALPLVGPVGGVLVGLGPDRLYASTAARVTAMVGVLLTGVGWLWARAVLRRAARAATTGRPS
ncbi:hypothetical protein [Oryzobacter telluris]|uniref:hypothetical protein n=1 Tax=Oryzobacter telluris TaxID=3149179 RepID=UPI00370DA1C9